MTATITTPRIILVVTRIDDASTEIIESAGGQVCKIAEHLPEFPPLFLVALPLKAILVTSISRVRHDISIEYAGKNHILLLTTLLAPNAAETTLQHHQSFEIDDYSDLDDGPR